MLSSPNDNPKNGVAYKRKRVADINQYPGWKASLHFSRHEIQKNCKEGQTDTNISTEEKTREKIQTYHKRHGDNDGETMIMNDTGSNEMECCACGLKGHKFKECQTKQNIYIVNLKKTLISKLKIQEEIQKYGNIKGIKVRHNLYEMPWL